MKRDHPNQVHDEASHRHKLWEGRRERTESEREGGREGATLVTVLTSSLSVLMCGGSSSLPTASANTKQAITTRNSPLTKPLRTSTRP